MNIEIEYNQGFDNRIFLTQEEWNTFRRRKPVRYIRAKHKELCAVCNKPATKDNPFQHSHKIGFELGIIYLALTPEFVDSMDNIVSAHRNICNKSAELSVEDSMHHLKSLGVRELPDFLPDQLKQMFNNL